MTIRMAWTSNRRQLDHPSQPVPQHSRPSGTAGGPAILMWNDSTNTQVDGNTFIDCQREIALGLIERTPNDHSGGIIRNNFIYRSGAGDSAIYVADSPNTQVLHNSIFISGTYANPIDTAFLTRQAS